jgi:hypothetical protein
MTDEEMLQEVKDLAWKLARSFGEDVNVSISIGGRLFTARGKVESEPLPLRPPREGELPDA